MGPVVQLAAPGVTVVAACVVAVCAATVGLAALTRARRRRRAALDAALLRSREEVESLSRKVEELTQEVVRSRRLAEQDREYVITSLGDGAAGSEERPASGRGLVPAPERPAVGELLEEQLVQALARQSQTPARRRWVDLAVGTLALGHGVRRALSADVLDRAAAEAHVARRRSRRDRRRQVRHARRREAA